jgi:hypothetical protein
MLIVIYRRRRYGSQCLIIYIKCRDKTNLNIIFYIPHLFIVASNGIEVEALDYSVITVEILNKITRKKRLSYR